MYIKTEHFSSAVVLNRKPHTRGCWDTFHMLLNTGHKGLQDMLTTVFCTIFPWHEINKASLVYRTWQHVVSDIKITYENRYIPRDVANKVQKCVFIITYRLVTKPQFCYSVTSFWLSRPGLNHMVHHVLVACMILGHIILEVLQFSLSSYHTNAPHSVIISCWYNKPTSNHHSNRDDPLLK